MRTPRTTPSRWGPRKPGHSARVISDPLAAGAAGCGAAATAGSTRRLTRRRGASPATGGRLPVRRCGGGSVLERAVAAPRREASVLVIALSQQPFLGSRRPPPVKLRPAAADAGRPHKRPGAHASRMAPTMDARRSPTERRRVATAQATRARPERESREVEQHPHPARSRSTGGRRAWSPHTATTIRTMAPIALGPGRPAEEQPPDRRRRVRRARRHAPRGSPIRQREHSASGDNARHAEREQPLQAHDGHAGPQPKGLPRSRGSESYSGHSASIPTSACRTSTREARAAGISDARTAAPTSTSAAPSSGRSAGQRTLSRYVAADTAERVAARGTGGNADRPR